jgi:hypothetical protein
MALVSAKLATLSDSAPAQSLAIVTSGASARTASVSATLTANSHDSSSMVQATVRAKADDVQVISAGEATASGNNASAAVALSSHVDPQAETVAVGGAATTAAANAAEGGIAAAAALASTQADTDDTHVMSSGNAGSSGETVSAAVTIDTSLGEQSGLQVVDIARAEAKAGGEAIPSATTSTDAVGTSDSLIISKEQETTMSDADHPVVLSVTYLQGVQAAPELAPMDALINSADAVLLQTDFGSSNEV